MACQAAGAAKQAARRRRASAGALPPRFPSSATAVPGPGEYDPHASPARKQGAHNLASVFRSGTSRSLPWQDAGESRKRFTPSTKTRTNSVGSFFLPFAVYGAFKTARIWILRRISCTF
eukprot:657222-Pleurochrysis_carterae.AAC.1